MKLSELCLGCGRCCSGKIFGSTSLAPDERRRFGCFELPQPCPHLGQDRRCAVYATRPKACAEYLCSVASALVRGELTLEEARARLG